MKIEQEDGKPIVLACVTDQIKCDRLIRSGRLIADSFSLDLKVINVETNASFGDNAGLGIEHLYKVSSQYNAEMTVYYHQEALKSVQNYILSNNVAHIVTGVPTSLDGSPFIEGLLNAFPKIPLTVVSEAGEFYLAQSTPYSMIIRSIA